MPNIRSGKSLFDDATLRATAREIQVCFDLVSLSLSDRLYHCHFSLCSWSSALEVSCTKLMHQAAQLEPKDSPKYYADGWKPVHL